MAKKDEFQKEVKALGSVLSELSDLTSDQRKFVLKAVADRLNIDLALSENHDLKNPDGSKEDLGAKPPADSEQKSCSPKEFLDQKLPTTDAERILCLAYYLTHHREQPHFKANDLSQINTEAAQPKFSNVSSTVKNATNQNGYLVDAPDKQKQISSLGEKAVRALPDRDRLKALLEKEKPRRRKKRAAKKKKK